jgi:hypothetical protein
LEVAFRYENREYDGGNAAFDLGVLEGYIAGGTKTRENAVQAGWGADRVPE